MKRTTVLTLLVLLAFGLSCKMVDQVAPGNSTLFLTAQPQQINANGVSTLTVTGIRGNGSGAPLPDGTVIRFTVDNAGTVSPNPVETRDGVAVALFHAANFSAKVNVTATSGTAINTDAKVEITVGDARATKMLLSASPSVLPFEGGSSQIRALVTDDDGNRLQGIGVQFTTDKGTLRSGGSIINTNKNGLAIDTLDTIETAVVSATTLNHTTTDSVTVTVGGTPLTVTFDISPTDPEVGDAVFFVDTTEDPGGTIRSWSWNFGDGATGGGKSTSHIYRIPGSFNVNLKVVDSSGNSFTGQASVTVSVRDLSCAFTSSPSDPGVGEAVSFNASASTSTTGKITKYNWDFGDLSSGSGVTTSHAYAAEGGYTVTLVITDNHGGTASCFNDVLVGCPTITLSPAVLSDGTESVPFGPIAFGASPADSYTFAIIGGSLPSGLVFSTSGILSGTPDPLTAGDYNFTVLATAPSGCSGSDDYSLTINP